MKANMNIKNDKQFLKHVLQYKQTNKQTNKQTAINDFLGTPPPHFKSQRL